MSRARAFIRPAIQEPLTSMSRVKRRDDRVKGATASAGRSSPRYSTSIVASQRLSSPWIPIPYTEV
jgi:hypothetical protein